MKNQICRILLLGVFCTISLLARASGQENEEVLKKLDRIIDGKEMFRVQKEATIKELKRNLSSSNLTTADNQLFIIFMVQIWNAIIILYVFYQ